MLPVGVTVDGPQIHILSESEIWKSTVIEYKKNTMMDASVKIEIH